MAENMENNELRILCDEIITEYCFDPDIPVWENSKLKIWLETECLKLINA